MQVRVNEYESLHLLGLMDMLAEGLLPESSLLVGNAAQT